MRRALPAVVLAACGGGAPRAEPPTPPPAPVSTTCLPADFAPRVFRVDGTRLHVCGETEELCAVLDTATGAWSAPTAAEAAETRALDVIGGAGFSMSEGVLEACEGDACTTFTVEDGAHVRGVAYDPAQDLLAFVTEGAEGSRLHVRRGEVVGSTLIDAERALVLAIVGGRILAGVSLHDPRSLEAVPIGGGEPWYDVGGWAHVSGDVWAFGDIGAVVVFQDVVTGEVKQTFDLWETAGMMLGPERVGEDLVVVRDREAVILSSAGAIRDRFTAPICD